MNESEQVKHMYFGFRKLVVRRPFCVVADSPDLERGAKALCVLMNDALSWSPAPPSWESCAVRCSSRQVSIEDKFQELPG